MAKCLGKPPEQPGCVTRRVPVFSHQRGIFEGPSLKVNSSDIGVCHHNICFFIFQLDCQNTVDTMVLSICTPDSHYVREVLNRWKGTGQQKVLAVKLVWAPLAGWLPRIFNTTVVSGGFRMDDGISTIFLENISPSNLRGVAYCIRQEGEVYADQSGRSHREA